MNIALFSDSRYPVAFCHTLLTFRPRPLYNPLYKYNNPDAKPLQPDNGRHLYQPLNLAEHLVIEHEALRPAAQDATADVLRLHQRLQPEEPPKSNY